MKKIIQTLKLRKLKTDINKEYIDKMNEGEFLVWCKDDTCKEAYNKYDLVDILSKDHIKPIRYIFSMADRIVLDRDVLIDINKIYKRVVEMKAKTADEMFTMLGYYRYDYLDHIDYYNEKNGKFISFRKNKTFACFGYDDEYKEITMQELQAINKKVEELG